MTTTTYTSRNDAKAALQKAIEAHIGGTVEVFSETTDDGKPYTLFTNTVTRQTELTVAPHTDGGWAVFCARAKPFATAETDGEAMWVAADRV